MSNSRNFVNNYNKTVRNCSTCPNYSQPMSIQNYNGMSISNEYSVPQYSEPQYTQLPYNTQFQYDQQRNNNSYITSTTQTTQNYKSKENLFDLYKPIPKYDPPNVVKTSRSTYILGAKKYN